ncbi:hypothetical protein [Nocardia salmonicida]|uniref:hypothetical protein n=1 Tax=Nocardia salmonicida TaxID=53431 RepID=UPI0007A3B197|nr:hypothetical protein [Nocardia salmonicida]MBC7303183.1 hypothetical protein [Nocardia sp.]
MSNHPTQTTEIADMEQALTDFERACTDGLGDDEHAAAVELAREAEGLLASYQRKVPDTTVANALRSVLSYNWNDERRDYLEQAEGRDRHIFGDLSAVARWLDIASAPTTCSAPAELRSRLVDGYDSDQITSVLGQISAASGLAVVCLWNYVDNFGFGGDSDFRILSPHGQLYYLDGDLSDWLTDTPDHAPAHPGSPASWIGGIDTDAIDIAGGDGRHSLARENRLNRSDDTSPTPRGTAAPSRAERLDQQLAEAIAAPKRDDARINTLSLQRIAEYLTNTVPAAHTLELDWDQGGLIAKALRDATGSVLDGDIAKDAMTEIFPWTWNLNPRLAGLVTDNGHGPFLLNLTQIATPRRAS